jgi:hypothetical protein
MKHLPQFILESLFLEANMAKETLIQETLTCMFFDAWFNMDERFDNINEIVEYYNANKDLIEKIASGAGLTINDYDALFLDLNTKGKSSAKAKQWQNSFIYQCESFENWINSHKSFDTDLVFVHHDTSIAVHNGKIENGWGIADRVDIGTKKFGYKDKDIYQKADIYAIVNKIGNTPEDDISEEVSYWVKSINGETSDKFVGISLKKLGRALGHVHTYGIDQSVINIDPKSINFKFDIFNNVEFDPAQGVLKPGIVTTSVFFDFDDGQEKKECKIDIRANSKGPKHAMIDPHVSYGAAVTVEMAMKGAKALAGKAQSLISEWIGEKMESAKTKGSADYKSKLNYIKSIFASEGVDFDVTLDDATTKFLNFLSANNEKIMDMYKSFEKNGKNLESIQPYLDELGINMDGSIKDIMDVLYASTKWHNVSWKILCDVEAIATYTKQHGINEAITQIYKTCKGISGKDSKPHLPYVLIGE